MEDKGKKPKRNPAERLGHWAKTGGPGRPKGSIDRVKAVEDAIQLQAQRAGIAGDDPHTTVAAWLGSLDQKDLSALYARILPKDIKMTGEMRVSFVQWLAALASGGQGEEGEE